MRIALVLAVITAASGCTCSKSSPAASDGGAATSNAPVKAIDSPGGLSAPIAAWHLEGGDVIVAGLDVPAKALRVQRIHGASAVVSERLVLEDVKWSADAELRMSAAGKGVVVTWRGLRGGKLVRQMLILGDDLAPRRAPLDVSAASCATRDTLWFSDGKVIRGIPLVGGEAGAEDAGSRLGWAGKLPADDEVSLVCGTHSAYAVIEGEETTSAITLGAGEKPATLLRENDFGDDESRERAEYVHADTLGIVRLGASGGLVLRELRGGKVGALRHLSAKLPQDDDIVAVDATEGVVAVAYTSDATDACKGAGHATKIAALRIAQEDERTQELASGTCGHEVGPFFTSAMGDGVMVAWVERASTEKGAKPPIVGLSYARVPSETPAKTVEQAADALVDAGCDATKCYAVALTRREDPMLPGNARVLTYP